MRRLALAALATVALAGCGSTTSGAGRATLWVTRDRGAVVLHVAKVPSGLTAMQAVDRIASVRTRYGGRYLGSVDGIEEHGRRAWFYYVNGYLADRAASAYRLRAGDVEWWDYRSWRDPAQDPVVVGSFPEPFLHGYDGEHRPAIVVTTDPASARPIARRLRARIVLDGKQLPDNANVLRLGVASGTRLDGRLRQPGSSPGSPVVMNFGGDPERLLRRPWPFRFRYQVDP